LIRIHASSLVAFADCARRGVATDPELSAILPTAGLHPRALRATVGAAVGSAVDAGIMRLLELKRDGDDWHSPEALGKANLAAIAMFRDEIRDGCVYDKPPNMLTPSPQVAEKQIERMVLAFYRQILPGAAPAQIQFPLEAAIGEDAVLVGQPDWLEITGRLHDLKTGGQSWPNGAQMGAYLLLCHANGIQVDSVTIDYVERSTLKNAQPPVESIEFNPEHCKRQAIAVLRRVKREVGAFLKTGDIEEIPVNPCSQFCKMSFCPLRQTDACTAWL
jgi:hypothetical protein